MENYVVPKMEIIEFEAEDVIDSSVPGGCSNELPVIKD